MLLTESLDSSSPTSKFIRLGCHSLEILPSTPGAYYIPENYEDSQLRQLIPGKWARAIVGNFTARDMTIDTSNHQVPH